MSRLLIAPFRGGSAIYALPCAPRRGQKRCLCVSDRFLIIAEHLSHVHIVLLSRKNTRTTGSMQPLVLWQTPGNLQPSIKTTISLTQNLKGILKRCIRSLSESHTKQGLQEQKPDREPPITQETEQAWICSSRQLSLKLPCYNYLLWKENCFLANPPRYTDQAQGLTRTPGSRGTQLLPRGDAAAAWGSGKALRFKEGFVSAPGWFLIHRPAVFPSGGEDHWGPFRWLGTRARWQPRWCALLGSFNEGCKSRNSFSIFCVLGF